MSFVLSSIFGTMLQTAAGVGLARTVGGFITRLNKRIFPFKGSSDEERMLYQHHLTEEQTKARQQFEARLRAADLVNQREIHLLTAFFNRQTTLQNSILGFSNTLKSKLFDDALRNYPLNIPPIVLLQNAGVSIRQITDKIVIDDPIAKDILSIADNGTNQKESLLSQYKDVFRHYPVALNVFVTPLMLDSRVGAKDKISTIVWDNIYQDIESLFINEYNRNGQRPINFYPTAWNNNAKPGLHASEILYFFTKGLPVVVLEPRYDGKQIRFIFSCWGIGSEPDKQIRQEIVFDLDWNSLVMPAMYQRSVDSLKKINAINGDIPVALNDLKKKLAHNVYLYEKLQEVDGINNDFLLDERNKLFFINNEDYRPLSKMISDALGISISLIADVHHLTSRGINPRFPELIESRFNEAFKSLTKPARHELMDAINGLMKSAYMELLLGDYDSDSDYSSFESQVEEKFEFLDIPNITDRLQVIDSSVSDNNNSENSCNNNSDPKSIVEIIDLIKKRCLDLNIEHESLSEQISELRIIDSHFIDSIEQMCKEQLMTLDSLTVL